jgi:hypothetical protein
MTQEALKLALEAFEAIPEEIEGWIPDKCTDAVIAIKQAIAELESQEPVAHQKWCASLTQLLLSMPPQPVPCNCRPPQRTWQGLTDDEHCDIWYKESLDWMEYGKAIEAKLKQKNGYAEEKNT